MLEETEAAERRAEVEAKAERQRTEVAKAARKAEQQQKRLEKRKWQEGEEEQRKQPRVQSTEDLESDLEEGSSQLRKCWYCKVQGMECTRTG